MRPLCWQPEYLALESGLSHNSPEAGQADDEVSVGVVEEPRPANEMLASLLVAKSNPSSELPYEMRRLCTLFGSLDEPIITHDAH
jgi:hypothetical protein